MSGIDVKSRPALAARVRLQTDATTGQPVLLYPEGIIELNATAHDIVSRCDGKTTLDEILASLAAEYDVSHEDLREDVFACLDELHRRNLIVFTP
jgi:pyrroloquinoline quinone biosynthesis protein D